MKTIIACTDFSPTAFNAVQYAAAVAKVAGARLVLYHAFTLPMHAGNSIVSADSFQKLLNNKVIRLKENAKSLFETYDIDVVTECSYAYIEDKLAELIKQYNADMLVMGMAERSLEQDIMGNTTTAAIRNINIPILAVPVSVQFNNPKKILFACDNPVEISQTVVEHVKEAAHHLNAELEIFSVDEKVSKLKSENSEALTINAVDNNFQGINYYYKNVRSNAVISEIKSEIEKYGADILIMTPHQYGFWASVVHRSKTRLMASGLNIPLLSVPA
ncbi:universal stress protein [Flavobacterium rhizosphaerae]|uniref:Universal stress protein n=1 Tax=Flavobacterium rhizosphaerae TaxID=3163298 RepID=A0ABW8YUS1_9FLAO